MLFPSPTSTAESASFLPAFLSIVGKSALLKRADQLMLDAQKSPFGWKIVTDYHWLEVEIAHMHEVVSGDEPGNSLDIRSIAALNFVVFVVEAHKQLSERGRKAMEGRLRDCLKTGFHTFYHEVATARQLMDENFSIELSDLEGVAEHDIVFRKGSVEGEVECKSLSADAGRKVHRKDFYRFVETLYAELESSVLADGYRATVLTDEDRFPSSVVERKPIGQAASRLLENRAAEFFNGPGFSIENIAQDQRLHDIAVLLIVLNRVARSVVDSVRGQHAEYVFVRYPKPKEAKPVPLDSMNTTAWKNGRKRAADKWAERTGQPAPDGFRRVRVHDLKHAFGRRLRAAGVSFEDRQDLLGHKSGRITTHYSAAELANLIAAAEKVCEDNSHKSPAITLLRRKAR
jgi:hypothetical protein